MRNSHRLLVVIAASILMGCATPWRFLPDGRHHSDAIDAIFRRRHADVDARAHHDPVMSLARDLTVIEDDLRRDGSITVKQPDVWGDGNLMYFLQEYDALIQKRTSAFADTVQAYIARSDRAEFESTTGLATALKGQTPAAAPSPSVLMSTEPALFGLLGDAAKAAPPSKTGVAIEPTESARQESTYIDICQALRRRHMGDDNSRAAGYGLYKFRIPVSVLPGRETTEGHAGIVTLRAQPKVDAAHLRYTYPKLVIADVVDKFVPIIRKDWGKKVDKKKLIEGIKAIAIKSGIRRDIRLELENIVKELEKPCADPEPFLSRLACLEDEAKKAASTTDAETSTIDFSLVSALLPPNAESTPSGPTAFPDIPKVFGPASIRALRQVAEEHIKIELEEDGPPSVHELRSFLFRYLGQVHAILEENRLYSNHQSEIIYQAAQAVVTGNYVDCEAARCAWICNAPANMDAKMKEAGWLLAAQAGLLDRDLKRIVEASGLKGKMPTDAVALSKDPNFHFFDLTDETFGEARLRLWGLIIQQEFPLNVFTLDPQVEEQNVYDAFARRREMQLALAYNVASGRFNAAQKLAFSRQLALDEATIGLNRTCVGFSHGNEVFGWYFYPRVQSPPTESTNIGAFARTVWSTGPTERYDQKHRKLEPGVRECEVLVAMPSFITEIAFDVTTNWESLARPGVTKRSYEEMVAQGARIHRLRSCLGEFCNEACYRPGDVQRLISRVDQLEQMVGLQTYQVNVPYKHEQSGTDLFDRGDAHLRPVASGFYGLEYLQPDNKDAKNLEAYFFVTGKNFHPTLTHVIVGGRESHSLPDTAGAGKADVEVVNRELIRVKVTGLNDSLSRKDGFQLRVGTPSGLSGPLTIPRQAPAEKPEKPKGWSFEPFAATALLSDVCCKAGLELRPNTAEIIRVKHDLTVPFAPDMNGLLLVELTAAKKDGTAITFGGGMPRLTLSAKIPLSYVPATTTLSTEKATWTVEWSKLSDSISEAINAKRPDGIRNEAFKLIVNGYVTFDKWPVTKLLNTIEITVEPCGCSCDKASQYGAAADGENGGPLPAIVLPDSEENRPPEFNALQSPSQRLIIDGSSPTESLIVPKAEK